MTINKSKSKKNRKKSTFSHKNQSKQKNQQQLKKNKEKWQKLIKIQKIIENKQKAKQQSENNSSIPGKKLIKQSKSIKKQTSAIKNPKLIANALYQRKTRSGKVFNSMETIQKQKPKIKLISSSSSSFINLSKLAKKKIDSQEEDSYQSKQTQPQQDSVEIILDDKELINKQGVNAYPNQKQSADSKRQNQNLFNQFNIASHNSNLFENNAATSKNKFSIITVSDQDTSTNPKTSIQSKLTLNDDISCSETDRLYLLPQKQIAMQKTKDSANYLTSHFSNYLKSSYQPNISQPFSHHNSNKEQLLETHQPCKCDDYNSNGGDDANYNSEAFGYSNFVPGNNISNYNISNHMGNSNISMNSNHYNSSSSNNNNMCNSKKQISKNQTGYKDEGVSRDNLRVSTPQFVQLSPQYNSMELEDNQSLYDFPVQESSVVEVIRKPISNSLQELNSRFLSQIVDIVICCDTTNSMGEYLEKTQQIVRLLYLQVKEILGVDKVDIKFGFVAYRDHPPEENSYLVKCLDLCEVDEILPFIKKLDAKGGGDIPEAVMDGLLFSVQKMSWRQGFKNPPLRYIIHLLDAPPHGDLYTGRDAPIMNRSFMWTGGCPCGITVDQIAKLMVKNKIQYRMIKIGQQLERTVKIFEQVFQNQFKYLSVNTPYNLDVMIKDMIISEIMPEDIE